MAAKWKTVSKSVVGVLATKIATENPDKQFDNLKAFLERTKKQMADLASTDGTKEVLEERILRTRAIIITFESRKSQLDNVLDGIQQNEQNDLFKNEWNSLEEQTKNVLKDLESVLDEWKQVDELREKLDQLLTQLDNRRESCCTLDSATDITGRLQVLKEDNLKTFSSLLQKLINIKNKLMEKSKTDELMNIVANYEAKLNQKETDIDDTLKALENKVEQENKYEKLKEKFRNELDNSLEILKNIRNEECDTGELQSCLALVKKLKSTRIDLQRQFEVIDEETKCLNIVRHNQDFDHVSQIWNTFCHELDFCQATLETQTSESRKVLYMLNSVRREIMKQEYELNDLQKQTITDKIQVEQKFDRIKKSLNCLKDVYITMESCTHQWEKLKKNGLSDDTIETKLQSTSEKLNALQYDFQALQEKTEDSMNTVDRVDEDCAKIKSNIKNITSYLAKVRLSEEDTNSDIQAKLSKIDQKLLEPCWDLLGNVESLNETLPDTFPTHFEAKNLKLQLMESDKEFSSVRIQLDEALTLLNEFGELCSKTNLDLKDVKESMPNVKKLQNLEEKIEALNQYRVVEKRLKEISQDELKKISHIQTTLNLIMCKKPAKDVTNKWKELIQTCLESITELSQKIIKEQTKINKRTEFINWVDSSKESIDQLTTNLHFDTFDELESLQANLNELQLNLKEKQDELRELEGEASEREQLQEQLFSMAKQVVDTLETISTISSFWVEFDIHMERLSSWLNLHVEKFNETKVSEKLNEKLSNLKELLFDVQGKESKINDLNGDAQKLNAMINSYYILQQTCSLINRKSQLRDEIESEIQCVDRWLFVKSQLKSLNQQISSVCDKLLSLVVSQDDLEDQMALIEEVQIKTLKFVEDIENVKNYDFALWPNELLNEFTSIDERFVKVKSELKSKQIEVQKIIDDENEKRLLSMAKSHECTPTVYETVEELNDFDMQQIESRKASLRLSKFSKRNRTNSNLFKRRNTKTIVPPRKHHESEGDQESSVVSSLNPSRESSICSSVDQVVTLPDLIESTNVDLTDRESSQTSSMDSFDRESSTSSSIPILTVTEHRTLWDRVRELAERVRLVDLSRSVATTTMKVLLEHLADVRRLWLAHGNFDFYNFDEINLHQTIQFVQLDILQLIEDCCRLFDTSSIIDDMISHISNV